MAFAFGPRRATLRRHRRGADARARVPLLADDLAHFETLDLIYRSLCALLYNYVPTSGHPGGSISSGRFVAGILFDALDYDLGDPDRDDADIVSYAAGHKAMGLYAMWALRDEIARVAAPGAAARRRAAAPAPRGPARLPPQPDHRDAALPQLRRQGARRPPDAGDAVRPALDRRLRRRRRQLDRPRLRGAATTTARTRRACTSSRARAASRPAASPRRWPRPARRRSATSSCTSTGTRRRSTATASAATAAQPGDYVQWTPAELFYLHDWNVIYVPDGRDFQQIIAAQRHAAGASTTASRRRSSTARSRAGSTASRARPRTAPATSSAPTGFYEALAELTARRRGASLPTCDADRPALRAGADGAGRAGGVLLGGARSSCAARIEESGRPSRRWPERLARGRASGSTPRPRAARRRAARRRRLRAGRRARRRTIPDELRLDARRRRRRCAASSAARSSYLNQASGGALLTAAADLLGSTSVEHRRRRASPAASGTRQTNPRRAAALDRRHLRGRDDRRSSPASPPSATHIGVGSSYGAFLAPLGHIAARLHAIGAQAREAVSRRRRTSRSILVCAHAGLKTGEDGPTHADPQALQLLQENFPRGTVITLTPWEPAGDLAAPGGGARAAAGGHRAVRHAAERDGARPRGARARARRGRRRRASTCCARPAGERRRDGRPAGERRRLRLRRGGAAAARARRASTRWSTTSPAPSSSTCCPRDERRAHLPRGARAARRWASPASRCRRCTAGCAPTRGRAATPAPLPQGPLPRQRPGRTWCSPRPASTARASSRAIIEYVERRTPSSGR